jgi:hypothetical protein
LLGFDAASLGLPCTVSVPNLKTDRLIGMIRCGAALNVRRLMYQPLIWGAVGRDEARGVLALADFQDLKRLADALVDSMRRNPKLDRDLFRGQMLVDKQQTVELAGTKSRHLGFDSGIGLGTGQTCHANVPTVWLTPNSQKDRRGM